MLNDIRIIIQHIQDSFVWNKEHNSYNYGFVRDGEEDAGEKTHSHTQGSTPASATYRSPPLTACS